eukprot:1795542-Prymnesium_polylepis.1
MSWSLPKFQHSVCTPGASPMMSSTSACVSTHVTTEHSSHDGSYACPAKRATSASPGSEGFESTARSGLRLKRSDMTGHVAP